METEEEMAARVRIPEMGTDERITFIKAQIDALRQWQRQKGHSQRVQIIDNILVQMLGVIVDVRAAAQQPSRGDGTARARGGMG